MGNAAVFQKSGVSVSRGRIQCRIYGAICYAATYCILIGVSSPIYAQQDEKSCDQFNHVQSVICSIKKLRQASQILTPEQVASYFGFEEIREAPKCLGQDCREYHLVNGRESSFRSGASLYLRPKEPNRADGYYVDIHVEIDDSKLCIALSDIEDAFGKDYKNSMVLTKEIKSDAEWESYLNSIRGLPGHIYYKFDDTTRSSMSFRFSYRPCANLINFSKRISIKGE